MYNSACKAGDTSVLDAYFLILSLCCLTSLSFYSYYLYLVANYFSEQIRYVGFIFLSYSPYSPFALLDSGNVDLTMKIIICIFEI